MTPEIFDPCKESDKADKLFTRVVLETLEMENKGTAKKIFNVSPGKSIVLLLLTVNIALMPSKAGSVYCTWVDANGQLHASDNRSTAPKYAECDDADKPETLHKKNTDKSNHGYSQFEIRLTESPPPALGDNPSNSELANAIFWLLGNKLDMPLPRASKVILYPDKPSFIEGLIESGQSHENAAKRAQHSKAVTHRNSILMRGDLLSHMTLLSRTALFAHELTHISQHELSDDGRRRAARWICEGHAEWSTFKILDIMGLRTFNESRARVIRAIKSSPTAVNSFPDIDTLTGTGKWLDARNEFGRPETYGQSFLAVDWLIERYGHAKLLELLGSYKSDTRFGKAWESVYPISYRKFTYEFRIRLENL